MKVEIPEKLIEKWTQVIRDQGYDSPETKEEWVEVIRESLEDRYGIE